MDNSLEPSRPLIGDANVGAFTGDMSANIVPTWIDVSKLDSISFDMQWTGTPTGTFYFRYSNQDEQPADETAGVDSAGTGWTNPSGSAGSNHWTINLQTARTKWLLFWYDNTSGTGALTVWTFGRGR